MARPPDQEKINVRRVASILTHLDKGSSLRLLDYISERDQALGSEIRSALFRFDDLLRLEDRDLKILLQSVPKPLLPLALKGVPPKMVEKITRCLSARAGEILKEELTMSGPKPRREVEIAQKSLTAIARLLLDKGKIFAPWMEGRNKYIY